MQKYPHVLIPENTFLTTKSSYPHSLSLKEFKTDTKTPIPRLHPAKS